MNILSDFAIKQRKYMPTFPKATGKLTTYIEGYPYEDDEPMAATQFHGLQITTLFNQFLRYFSIDDHIYVGVDSFIYYEEGDITKGIAPDIYVVLGVEKYPLRRSFYTWAEGAAPATVIEFLTDSTEHQDRDSTVALYLQDMGAQEYFIHQPEMAKPSDFRGWQRGPSGEIIELEPDADGGLFSAALNLWLRWEDDQTTHVRLLRPYLPDGTPIPTSMELHRLHEEAEPEKFRYRREELRRLVEAAEARAEAERHRREELRRREAAEARVSELEAELERLRAQMANRNNQDI